MGEKRWGYTMQDNDGKCDVRGTTGQTNLTMSTPIRKGLLTNAGSNPLSAKTAETLATLDIKVPIVPTTMNLQVPSGDVLKVRMATFLNFVLGVNFWA
jgi:hypothetical protein